MGNSGRSSTGCGLCRKRKIKCDEGRPGCKKCAAIKKPCPGYSTIELHVRPDLRNGGGPSFNDQRQYSLPHTDLYTISRAGSRSVSTTPCSVESSIERPKFLNPHAPQESPVLQIKSEAAEHEVAQVNHSTPTTRPISPPKYDVQHQATCFFLHLFSYQARKLYGAPVLDFLPDMLEKSEQHTPIQHAAKAVSRMTLADRYSGQDVRLQTSFDYAKALNSVAVTMSNEDEALKDELIIAVWLLGLYEAVHSVLSHGRTNQKFLDPEEEWRSHIQHMRGAMRLLRIRGKRQFSNARSERIFRVFKAAIQMRLFVLNSVTSADFEYLEVDIYKDEHEFVPSETANKASKFFIKAAQHLEHSKYTLQKFRLQPRSEEVATEIDELLYYGECLDADMLGWSKQEPGWDMMPIRGQVRGTMWALYPAHALYYFYSFWVFLYWLRFLIARIKLYESLAELLKVKKQASTAIEIEPSSLTQMGLKIESFTHVIQKTADDLIGLTAYALGDVTSTGFFQSSPSGINPGGGWYEVNAVAAMQLVIPFKVLLRSPYTLPAQKGAINLAISHIADGFRRQPIVPEFLRC